MRNNDTYHTKDLTVSAVFLTLGRKIMKIEIIVNICWFIFVDSKKCQEIVNRLWYDRCMVDAKSYYNSITKLKNRIFSS